MSAHRHDHADAAAHHHHHHHGGGTALLVSVGLTLGFAGVETVAGGMSGSLALLADAGHLLTDGMSLALAAVAAWLARRPPSARHTYGYGRAEVLAALANAVLMLLVIAGIAWAAVGRLQAPRPVAGETVTLVALLGLLVNVAVAWVLLRGERTLNVRGALLHVMGDLLGSVAALVSGAVIVLTGWTAIDPLLSLLIAGLILSSSLGLLHDALRSLLDAVPKHLSSAAVGQALAEVPGVVSVHDLHVWMLSGDRAALSAHVVVADAAQWGQLLPRLLAVAHGFGIEHSTFQPETREFPIVWGPYAKAPTLRQGGDREGEGEGFGQAAARKTPTANGS